MADSNLYQPAMPSKHDSLKYIPERLPTAQKTIIREICMFKMFARKKEAILTKKMAKRIQENI